MSSDAVDLLVVTLLPVPACWLFAFAMPKAVITQILISMVISAIFVVVAFVLKFGGGASYAILFGVLYAPFWIGSVLVNCIVANAVSSRLEAREVDE